MCSDEHASTETKLSQDGAQSDVSAKGDAIVFTIEQIRQCLWPVLQNMIGHPESEPFRKPVDYIALGLLDYLDVVKEPMDLSTIRKMMFDEQIYCRDPWLFVQHMQLMFSNAWLYNRKATKIYKFTTRVSYPTLLLSTRFIPC